MKERKPREHEGGDLAEPGKTPGKAEGGRDPETKPSLEPGRTPGSAEREREVRR